MISAYRRVFATPRLRVLMLIGLVGKIPGLGIPAVLILHVVYGLHLGFGPAGLVAAVWTAGVGVGAPLIGRSTDRFGLRVPLVIIIGAQAAFWGLAHFLPFGLLIPAAFAGGMLVLPAFTIIRLALAVMVTEEIRHTSYVADSISTDLAYMVGPSLGILLASQVSPTTAFLIMGGLLVLGAVGFLWANPPLQAREHDRKPKLVEWLSVHMGAILGVTIALTTAVVGFEVAAIGTLQRLGQLEWSWLFLIVCGLASIAGGLVYGAQRNPPPAALITLVLGIAVIPIGFADHWLWLCALAVPANFLVAPALSATATAVSRLAPEGSKGIAMGAYASALMVGTVAGSPLAGTALDIAGSVASFAAVGTASAVMAGIAIVVEKKTAVSAGRPPTLVG
jgi:MFS family permease